LNSLEPPCERTPTVALSFHSVTFVFRCRVMFFGLPPRPIAQWAGWAAILSQTVPRKSRSLFLYPCTGSFSSMRFAQTVVAVHSRSNFLGPSFIPPLPSTDVKVDLLFPEKWPRTHCFPFHMLRDFLVNLSETKQNLAPFCRREPLRSLVSTYDPPPFFWTSSRRGDYRLTVFFRDGVSPCFSRWASYLPLPCFMLGALEAFERTCFLSTTSRLAYNSPLFFSR